MTVRVRMPNEGERQEGQMRPLERATAPVVAAHNLAYPVWHVVALADQGLAPPRGHSPYSWKGKRPIGVGRELEPKHH